MTRPIAPRDVAGEKSRVLPDAVVETWNRLIALAYVDNGAGRGYARVSQSAAIEALLPLVPEGHLQPKQYIHKSGWLDIEAMYRARGWQVKYDRPGYSETYQPVFEFEAWGPKSP